MNGCDPFIAETSPLGHLWNQVKWLANLILILIRRIKCNLAKTLSPFPAPDLIAVG